MTAQPPFRFVVAVATLAVVAFSCGGSLGPLVTSATWNGNGSSSPSSVTVSIASVTLGDDCGGGGGVSAGACAEGMTCGSPCRDSGLQLSVASGPGNGASTLSIESVEVYDARSGDRVATLTPGAAQTWTASGAYGAWDGRIGPSSSQSVSFPLSSMDWSRVSEGNGGSAYDARFRVQVVVRVDGEERTLVSSEIGREAQVVT